MTVLVGKDATNLAAEIQLNKLNRHGFIAGATGTGKTITLKVVAEQLSKAGIPVFLSDIKGDLASLAEAGQSNEAIGERVTKLGLGDYENRAFPIQLLDVFSEKGVPVRTTISEMGPILLTQLLGLNDIQEGILNIAFKIADDRALLMIDLDDLRSVLNLVADEATELKQVYGNISSASVGAILRSLLVLEQQGGDLFFGEPSFDILDLLAMKGTEGVINILSAEKLYQMPKLYACFLLWLLSELFENLPEVGDLDQPKIVFFFDEAHTLFDSVSTTLLEKIELMVRLIRSKGVGVFFITQNPTDIPDSVLAQLGNRIQHGLRAYTPKEKKTLTTIASTFRQNEDEDLADVIANLGTGEAVVSFLAADGIPTFASKITVCPPESKIGTIEPMTLMTLINQSTLNDKYGEAINRESAFELLTAAKMEVEARKIEEAEAKAKALEEAKRMKEEAKLEAQRVREEAAAEQRRQKELAREEKKSTTTKRSDSNMDRFTKNVMSTVGREVGRIITRTILGTFTKK